MSIQLTVRGNLGQNCELKEIKRNDGETGFVLNFSVASTRYKRQNIDGQDRYVPDGPVEWIETFAKKPFPRQPKPQHRFSAVFAPNHS